MLAPEKSAQHQTTEGMGHEMDRSTLETTIQNPIVDFIDRFIDPLDARVVSDVADAMAPAFEPPFEDPHITSATSQPVEQNHVPGPIEPVATGILTRL